MAEAEERSYQRKLKRHDVPPMTVNVVDAVNNAPIGRLVNLHQEGLMLVSEQQLSPNSLYQFELHLPQAINGRDKIALGVDCLWSRSTVDESVAQEVMYWAGCKIIDIADQALIDLENLIALLKQ